MADQKFGKICQIVEVGISDEYRISLCVVFYENVFCDIWEKLIKGGKKPYKETVQFLKEGGKLFQG